MACAGLHSPVASALTLGTITVQSALGEPLRAEIDLPQITPAEAESLRASTASPDVFRAQGMEYSSIASQMRLQLQRRPDGRMVLGLTGNRPVNEPFVDLVVDARWSAGQVTRSYTMLFDPPAPRRSQAATPVLAPSFSAPASSVAAPVARRSAARAEENTAANDSNESNNRDVAAAASQSRAAATPRGPTSQSGAGDAVRVTAGDTAGRIANARRQQGVSLDQMLVAMSRANPSAFVQGNVNRLKAGSVLQIPTQEEALATSQGQARQMIAVQSRDFNAFRRRLAGAAPDAEQADAQRSAKGSVQTRTEDSSATAVVPDKLTLSKGAMQGKKTSEEMLAQRKQGNEAAARAQELARNIAELNQLNAASTASDAAVGSSANTTAVATASGLAVPNPGLAALAEPASSPALAADTDADADAAQNAMSQDAALPEKAAEAPVATGPALAPPVPAVAPAPESQQEPGGFVQDLMDQPAMPLAAGALLLLLAYGGYRAVQRRRSTHIAIDSSFVDSRVHPDSFFGATGGQRVDTASADSSMCGPSLSYSHSQLDVGGEVDPVAEADVYLAYGRDLQAEEILREAARQQPQRVAIVAKLGEIYAKRLDGRALEVVARDVQRLTQGQGADWERMVELGLQLDPNNALYQSGTSPSATSNLGGAAAAGALSATMANAEPVAVLPLDLDLELDFDLPEDVFADAQADDLQDVGVSDSPVPTTAVAADEDWDALEDLVAFNAAIAVPAPSDGAKAGLRTGTNIEDQLDSGLGNLDVELDWAPEPSPAIASADRAEQQADNASASISADDQLDAFALNFDLPELNASALDAGTDNVNEIALSKDGFVATQSHLLDFDFDSLSLDLDAPELAAQDSMDGIQESGADLFDNNTEGDPLVTKLALAHEFHAIGDSEGARALTEEVISESSGELKQRAKNLLAELD